MVDYTCHQCREQWNNCTCRFHRGRVGDTHSAALAGLDQHPRAALVFYPFPEFQPPGAKPLLLITSSKVFRLGDLYGGKQWRTEADHWSTTQANYVYVLKSLSDVIYWAELPDAVALINGHRDARHAAAQLAAVAAPEARIEGQSLDHPAVNDSPSALRAAPLSEPCALDQGARPVRPVNEWQYRVWWNGDGGEPMGWGDWTKVRPRSRISTVEDHVREIQDSIAHGHRYELRALYVGIAPPVAQQEGSTQ